MFVDANGNQFHSYDEACHYYGCDTPDQLAADEAAEHEDWLDHCAAFDHFPRGTEVSHVCAGSDFDWDPKASAWVNSFPDDDECPF